MKLQNRVAIVTGAGSSLGLAIARRLAADGAAIAIADIQKAGEAAKLLSEEGYNVIGSAVDVSSEDSVTRFVGSVVARLGTVDILVNNAALSSSLEGKPFERVSVDEWRRVLDVNLLGPFLCCRAVAPIMRSRQYGRIINLASTVALKGVPFMSHYVASKGGLISLTRTLAHELGSDKITVNAVAPGYLLTDGNLSNPEMAETHRTAAIAGRALRRDGFSEDLVGSISFLASNDAAFVTGQVLAVDGGSAYH